MASNNRENLLLRTTERWQPPAFSPADTRSRRVIAAARRFFDLQAASIWRDLSAVLPGARGLLVDVGCGAQPYRGLLSADTRYLGLDIYGADEGFGYSMPVVRRFAEGGPWPVDDASADVVLATETLEHVADPGQFVAEARRVLLPGGRLIITVPFAARWHYIRHDYWRFTPSGLRLLLEGAGFEQLVVHARGNERTVACYKALALLLPLVLPQRERGRSRVRLAGLLLAPVMVLLGALGNLSLRGGEGDDCLGYTATAVAAPEPLRTEWGLTTPSPAEWP
ncbi:MAG: class I SAM-dependent methyltransferase [Solirubrobacteraceae bacterium]